MGVAGQLPRVAPQPADRGRAFQDGRLPFLAGGAETAPQLLDIVHGAAEVCSRQLDAEVVPRLEQDAFRHHQALADRPQGRLPEVAPFGVLEVGFAGDEGDLDIGEGRAGQHAPVLFLLQVGEDQPLPVAGQHFLAAVGVVLDVAAGGQGFQFQVDLGVVAEGLVVAHPLHRLGDGLFVEDAALPKGDVQPEPAGQQTLQHFQLDLAHQADVDLPQRLVPDHVQFGHFLLDAAELGQGGVDIRALGQKHLVCQHRLEQRVAGVPFGPQALAGLCVGKAGHGADLAGQHLARQGVFCPRVEPQLVGFGGPARPLGAAGEGVLDLQNAARHPQPGQAGPLLVLRNLEHPRAEVLPGGGGTGPAGKPFQQGVHPVQLEGRAEPAREHVPPRNGGDDVPVGQGLARKVGFHQALVAQGQGFVPGGGVRAEVHKTLPQMAAQLVQQRFPAGAGQVHLIYKKEGGHPAAPQQGPQCLGVALHPVGAADDQHRVIQHPHRALGLGRKVHVAGGVQPGDLGAAPVQLEQGLFGKYGDAPGPLQAVGVQKGVPVVLPESTWASTPTTRRFVASCMGGPLTKCWRRCRWRSSARPRAGWPAYCTGPFLRC